MRRKESSEELKLLEAQWCMVAVDPAKCWERSPLSKLDELRITGFHQVVDIVGFGNGTRCQKRRIGNNAVDKRLTLTVCEDYYRWNDWPELDDLDHSMAQWLRVGHAKDNHP